VALTASTRIPTIISVRGEISGATGAYTAGFGQALTGFIVEYMEEPT